jgi:formiminotetrahydrofolate cyclodeaminase
MKTGRPSGSSEPNNPAASRDDPYLSRKVGDLLDDLAARTPAPGGGAAAALTCAMGAALVEMATSFASAHGLERVHERARAIRAEVESLAHADADAYGRVLESLRMPPGNERTAKLDAAVAGAIEVPIRVMELASEVAVLAADVAQTGNRNLEGDALAGSLLAEAAARSAATLAQLNVSMLSKHAAADAHLERLRPALAQATRARERAVAAYAGG